jgi:hypothetical protein
MLWLANPYPDLPSPTQAAEWRTQYGWPFEHRPRALGGDLIDRDQRHYDAIAEFNREFFFAPKKPRALILFINQLGWDADHLGLPKGCDLGTFEDARIGSDVELGLSVYEPYGLAPLEPFFSGKVCVVSDAFGCAELLQKRGGGKVKNLVVAKYIEEIGSGAGLVSAPRRRQIEKIVAHKCAREVEAALGQDRKDRITWALGLDDELSWDAVFREFFLSYLPEQGASTD